ncbi:hypothetical protein [Pantoea sp. 1.19]|uniref:hypothetical protein n=1 Tax=Pantoea sp. 1.19 TaxID=1925589 RepID=UPI00094890BF|nr:hypothetical protein [Pantoea sp. 1.19]
MLRIDPSGWQKSGSKEALTLGKRCARLDGRPRDDSAAFARLLAQPGMIAHAAIAGPVIARFLPGVDAEVLRIDPSGWQESGSKEALTLGKRCARLDGRPRDDSAAFTRLLAQPGIRVHG